MLILVCADPLHPRQPDPLYAADVAAAQGQGLATALINFEALVDDGDAARAVARVPEQAEPTLGVFRGWMLRPAQYAALYGALLARNIRLINDPAAYRHCHYLPESYAAIAEHTPRSVWLPVPDASAVDFDAVVALLQPFGNQPIILKDYVKSRKHEWAEACYIPDASDQVAVERVVRRFLALQGGDLNEGLVLRAFVDFAPIGAHPQSGMPLTREYRSFWRAGVPIFWTPYWDEGTYDAEEPPLAQFTDVAQRIQSRFFTMDIAQQRDGGWLIVELGDGQVAGLPDRADRAAFYRALATSAP